MNIQKLAWWLVIIGGLNWGLVGLLNLNLVDSIFGMGSMIARIVYIVVGLATVYAVYGMMNKGKK